MPGMEAMVVKAETLPRVTVAKAEMEATVIQAKVVMEAKVGIVLPAEVVMGAMEVMGRRVEARAGRAVVVQPGMEIVGVMVQKGEQL